MVKIVLGLLAGLVLFLYGVTHMSDGLRAIAGDRMKRILGRFTTNRFAGVLTGAIATTVLDSSSVTIVMVIAMVNAGVLTFVQSLGVIMGSNIGTTVSSQLIAFNVDEYAPLALLAGFVLHMMGKTERRKQIGSIVLGIGLIFFGLGQMGNAVEPLRDHRPVLDLLARLESPWLGVLIGAALTVLIQSSSATLGIVITLASQGLITLPAGIAVMLGAEIGTCADTLVATVGRSREAVRAGVFHLLFNITTVIAGVLFVEQFTRLALRISGGADVARQIANAHMLFNVLGVLVFIGATPLLARALLWLLPDSRAARRPVLEPSSVTT